MRKSSCYGEKLYVPGNGLSVSGRKIELSKITRPPKRFASRPIRIDQGQSPVGRTVERQGKQSLNTDKRKVFRLNVTDCNFEAYNKQLKEIYQAVNVDDFERILKEVLDSDESRKQGKRRRKDVLEVIRAEEIYEEFFGRHYEYLKNTMVKS